MSKKTKIENEFGEGFAIISYEELKEFEYNIEFNPFDTTGCGYLSDDFIDFLKDQNREAFEYYYKNKNKKN